MSAAPAHLVVIGASLGGIDAVQVVLRGLSRDFPWAVAVVLHRSADDVIDTLRRILSECTPFPVREVEDKDPIAPGMIYVAPSDYHLLVAPTGFALSTDAKVHFARPCIDVLLDSAAAEYGDGLVAVILTGASIDGAAGAARVKAEGGIVVVQDPDTAESSLMPRAAVTAVAADAVLPVAEIGAYLNCLAAARPPVGPGSDRPHASTRRGASS